jgi:Flp pilus assembly protein protease CpaA
MIRLLREPLFCAGVAALWLLPCALQDCRTRRVSNWLTVPFFLLAWPFAFLTGHLALTFAVLVGVYVASQVEPRFGGADAKLMVGLAALAPLGLGIAVLLEMVVFAVLRLRRRTAVAIPGVLWLCLGALLNLTALLVAKAR